MLQLLAYWLLLLVNDTPHCAWLPAGECGDPPTPLSPLSNSHHNSTCHIATLHCISLSSPQLQSAFLPPSSPVPVMVELKVGDQFPTSVSSVTENNPGQQVDLAKELGKGKVIVFGVPGAVSAQHTTAQHSTPQHSTAHLSTAQD